LPPAILVIRVVTLNVEVLQRFAGEDSLYWPDLDEDPVPQRLKPLLQQLYRRHKCLLHPVIRSNQSDPQLSFQLSITFSANFFLQLTYS
jgi:hypothetical protein